MADLQNNQRNNSPKTRKVYNKKLDPTMSYLRTIYTSQKCDANPNHRNIEWTLTLDEWVNIVQQKCSICGSEPVMKQGKLHKKTGQQVPINGVDRIDNDKGYVIDNVRCSCSNCNYMKHNMNDIEFMEHIKKIWSYNFANI
jgi:hypothetical protein